MSRNFKLNIGPLNDPTAWIRIGLGVLLAANLVAAYFVFRPLGGSSSELRQQSIGMHEQIREQQEVLNRMRSLSGKVELGRGEGGTFMSKYFLPRRTAYSIILGELDQMATRAKVTPKESAYSVEPVDGSDTLEMMQITIAFEGTYGDLLQFINLVDKSTRLIIVDSLNATPQQNSKRLNVLLKLDTFVIEDGSES